MVIVVVPAGIVQPARWVIQRAAVPAILGHQMHIGEFGPQRPRHLLLDGWRGQVLQLVDCVEPQAVKVIVAQPVPRAVQKEGAHRGPRVVDLLAPIVFLVAKEFGADLAQHILLRAEMVEHHVQVDRQTQPMRRVDQPRQILGPAIAVLRRIGQRAVIAPASGAGELAQRHQFDRGNAQLGHPAQFGRAGGGGKGAGGSEAADMHLGNHLLREGGRHAPRTPIRQPPQIAQHGMPLDPAPLLDRGRIGKAQITGAEPIDRPLGRAGPQPVHTILAPLHRQGRALQLQKDFGTGGCP